MKIYKIMLIAFGASLCANSTYASSPTTISSQELQRFTNTINSIHRYYIKPVKNQQLIDDAINGMLTHLDPHSAYLDKDDLNALDVIISGKFDGIGITVMSDLGALKVVSPIDGSPADKVGIKPGDLIVRINDKLIKEMPLAKAIHMIRGKRGSKVTLYIIRNHQPKPIRLIIRRSTIKVPTVKEKLLENHYGYLRIGIFYQTTQKDLLKAIKQLQRQSHQQLRGIIIDLRNNPGGLFGPAIQVADDFLDAKKFKANPLIVYTQGYPNNKRDNFNATRGELLPNIPIVALINAGSASAAEIVAGALQDHKRAIIIGTRSFGKGSVQTVLPIDKHSAIKLTTALYYTPTGRSIQAQGINPDVVVKALKISKAKIDTLPFDPIYEEDLANHIKNGNTTKIDKQAESNLIKTDFQLYQALNILKGFSTITQ